MQISKNSWRPARHTSASSHFLGEGLTSHLWGRFQNASNYFGSSSVRCEPAVFFCSVDASCCSWQSCGRAVWGLFAVAGVLHFIFIPHSQFSEFTLAAPAEVNLHTREIFLNGSCVTGRLYALYKKPIYLLEEQNDAV